MQLLDGRHDRRAVRAPFGSPGGLDDADQLDAVQAGEDPGVVAAHRAEADQAGAQRLRPYGGAHADSPVLFTASAMRSSSRRVRLREDRQRDDLGGRPLGLRQVPRSAGRAVLGSRYGLSRWIGVG